MRNKPAYRAESGSAGGVRPRLVREQDLGPLLRRGSSRLYQYGADRLLRVYNKPLETLQREIRRSLQARQAGLPAVELEAEPVRLEDGSFGIVLCTQGVLASMKLKAEPRAAARIHHASAALLAALHRAPGWSELPSQRQLLFSRISQSGRLDLRSRQQALRWLEQLPDGSQVCHGNFQSSEIVLTADGGPIATGWRNASSGNPLADLAHTLLVLRMPAAHHNWLRATLVRWSQKSVAARLCAAYQEASGSDMAELDLWLKVCAASRTSERRRNATELGFLIDTVRG